MYNCPKCKAKERTVSSRISHLESAKWGYEQQKGKGSFKRDNPVADKLLTSLVIEKVDLAVDHVKNHVEGDSGDTCEGATPMPRVG